MPRPLLTDDVIEEARREKKDLDRRLMAELEADEEISSKYEKIERKQAKNAVYKSRRIENAKAKDRSHKINKYLTWTIILVIILFVAFFGYYFTNF